VYEVRFFRPVVTSCTATSRLLQPDQGASPSLSLLSFGRLPSVSNLMDSVFSERRAVGRR
jgi:hypothetical protein